MGHDTHQAHSTENKTIISFRNSFWLIVILVGLFIASLNFVQAESGGEEEGHGAATHETHKAEGHGAKAGTHATENAGAYSAEHAPAAAPKEEAAHTEAAHTEAEHAPSH